MCFRVVAKPTINGRIITESYQVCGWRLAVCKPCKLLPAGSQGPQTADCKPTMPNHPVLASEQVALFTLMAQLAVGAVLSTMLVRFQWFRRILLTEKRDWPERLIFAASLGL